MLVTVTTKAEAMSWISSVREKIKSGIGPTTMVHSLVCLGPNPVTEFTGDDGWIKENHKEYNMAIWVMFAQDPVTRAKIRRVLMNDLHTTTENPEYGEIARKDYAELLLENFLIPSPNFDWVGCICNL